VAAEMPFTTAMSMRNMTGERQPLASDSLMVVRLLMVPSPRT